MLTLGARESTWGTLVSDLPPSLGEYTGYNGTGNNTASGQPYKLMERAVVFDEGVVPASESELRVKTGGNYWAEAAG